MNTCSLAASLKSFAQRASFCHDCVQLLNRLDARHVESLNFALTHFWAERDESGSPPKRKRAKRIAGTDEPDAADGDEDADAAGSLADALENGPVGKRSQLRDALLKLLTATMPDIAAAMPSKALVCIVY